MKSIEYIEEFEEELKEILSHDLSKGYKGIVCDVPPCKPLICGCTESTFFSLKSRIANIQDTLKGENALWDEIFSAIEGYLIKIYKASSEGSSNLKELELIIFRKDTLEELIDTIHFIKRRIEYPIVSIQQSDQSKSKCKEILVHGAGRYRIKFDSFQK